MKAPLLKSIIESGQLTPDLHEQVKEALTEEDPAAADEIRKSEQAGDLDAMKAEVEGRRAELATEIETAKEIAAKIPEAQPQVDEAEAAAAEADAAAEQIAAADDLEMAQEAKATFDEAVERGMAACQECRRQVPGYEEPAEDEMPEESDPAAPAPEAAAGSALGTWADKTAEGM